MAQVLTTEITWRRNSPYGTYVSGDVVSIYYDTSTSSIVVKKNGGTITSGNSIPVFFQYSGNNAAYYKTEVYKNTVICESTTRIELQRSISAFPYVVKTQYQGSPSCATSPIVCDLEFNSLPVITNETQEGAADGEITVSATSSNDPIEYKLGSDFTYGYGQSSGTFTGVTAGSYIIYARDSGNCSANIAVNVAVDQTYQTVYRLEYDDRIGNVTRVDIQQRGFGQLRNQYFTTNINYWQNFDSGNDWTWDAGAYSTTTGVVNSKYLRQAIDIASFANGGIDLSVDFELDTVVNVAGTVSFVIYGFSGSTPIELVSIPIPGAGTTTITGQSLGLLGNFDYIGFRLETQGGEYEVTVNQFLLSYEGYNEVKGGGDPVLIRLRGEAEEDKFTSCIGTELEISLASETNNQFVTLFTSDPQKFRVTFQKDFGAGFETLLTTKLVPNQYREDYIPEPYIVNFICTDSLAELKNIPFLDVAGNRFFGKYRCIELVAFCLKQTGLNLSIRVAANVYAATMDSTDSDDPLDQAYVDVDAYYLKDDKKSCLDVIKAILSSFGAQLFQWNNVWNIIRVEERVQDYDYRDFDSSGTYVSNDNYDPVLVSGSAEAIKWVANPVMEMSPAYGKLRLKYRLGFKDNIIINGDFKLKVFLYDYFGVTLYTPNTNGFQLVANGDDGVTIGYQIVESDKIKQIDSSNNNSNVAVDKFNIALDMRQATGLAYIVSKNYNLSLGGGDQIKFTIKCALPIYPGEVPYVKVRCVIQYGTYYLQGDGTWVASANEIIFFCKEYGKFVEFSITSKDIPSGASSGLDFSVKVYHAYVNQAEFDNVTDQRAKVTTTLGLGHRTERVDTSGFDLFYYELENNTSSESVPDIVRPNDYNATTNPVQWILKATRDTGIAVDDGFFIDKIDVDYLFQGQEPPESFDDDINGEENNNGVFEKEVVHGSLVDLVQTSTVLLPIFTFNPSPFPQVQYINIPVQNTSDTYCGYFRDIDGVGFETWSRSYFSEAKTINRILLEGYGSQYNTPWRRLRGSLTSNTVYFTPLNVVREYDDRIYYPVSLEIDDKNVVFSGEFLELTDVVSDDEGDTAVGFSLGFSLGFEA